MDDARIKQLTDEVMAELGRGAADSGNASPPAACGPDVPQVHVTLHASHHLLDVVSGSTDGRCVLEPNRACIGSGLCRTLGH